MLLLIDYSILTSLSTSYYIRVLPAFIRYPEASTF
nr:MAG TPA: hypothetical protein [Caudoviricetes sp.]